MGPARGPGAGGPGAGGDANDIRQAAGYDKVIFYGTSYGTSLGKYLLRYHADVLEAFIPDRVAPAEFTQYSQVNNMQNSFRTF